MLDRPNAFCDLYKVLFNLLKMFIPIIFMLEMEELSNVESLALVIYDFPTRICRFKMLYFRFLIRKNTKIYESFTINCIISKVIIKHELPLTLTRRSIFLYNDIFLCPS